MTSAHQDSDITLVPLCDLDFLDAVYGLQPLPDPVKVDRLVFRPDLFMFINSRDMPRSQRHFLFM